mmetsp:Transcript_5667/g.21362  ORF Transcript_5667/g.21362 Transcript_5667/m.21362 type:complete len:117 (+) Transcript_5667:1791-2141(+)
MMNNRTGSHMWATAKLMPDLFIEYCWCTTIDGWEGSSLQRQKQDFQRVQHKTSVLRCCKFQNPTQSADCYVFILFEFHFFLPPSSTDFRVLAESTCPLKEKLNRLVSPLDGFLIVV